MTNRSLSGAGASVVLLSVAILVGCSSDGSDGAATTTTESSQPTTTAEAPDTSDTSTADTTATTEGGGEGDGERQAYVDAFASGYESEGDVLMSQEQAQCLGSGYVDIIGLDALQTAGVEPESVSEGSGLEDLSIDDESASGLYDQFAACDIDPKELYISFAEAFLEGPVTPEQRSCLEGVLTDENLRRSFVADVVGEDLDPDPLDAADDCAPLSLDVPEAETVPTIAAPPDN